MPLRELKTGVLWICEANIIWCRDDKVDEELAKQILDNCKELAPELLDRDDQFQVVSHQVGFRPSRHGGPRVEFEELKGGLKVVHCYGHAGGG